METLNLTNPTSVQEIFEQVSRMLPFRVTSLAALDGVLPTYPNQLAIVDNVGVFMYRVATSAWTTAESTELEAELADVQQTLTNLAAYMNQQFIDLNSQINSIQVTADQISGLDSFVRGTTLLGLTLDNAQPVVAGTTILQAAGRLQRQINDLATTLSQEVATLTQYVDLSLQTQSDDINAAMTALANSLNSAMATLEGSVNTQLANLSSTVNLRTRNNLRFDPASSAAAAWDFILVATAGRIYSLPAAGDRVVGDEFYIAVDSIDDAKVNFGTGGSAVKMNGALIDDGIFLLDVTQRIYGFKYISTDYGYKVF